MGLIEDLEAWQKDYLEDYCLNECRDNCCENLITVSREALELFPEARRDMGSYVVGPPCSKLDANYKKCTIHDNPKRMMLCQSMPTFLDCMVRNLTLEIFFSCPINNLPETHPMIKSIMDVAKKYKINIWFNTLNTKRFHEFYESTPENQELIAELQKRPCKFNKFFLI